MPNQISFIHAADLHLDSPFKGLVNIPDSIFREIRNSTFTALERLVYVAIEKKVDFVLIVGDLFDNERQSLKAQIHLRKAFEELERHQINVYLSYGNHDHINGNIHPITYPSNVFIFPDESIKHFTYEKNNREIAAIYGFSYENRSVLNNKAAEYQVVDKHVPFHIAMLHGSLQNNTDHDTYAPFQINELTEKPFDYWALGHIHQREILKNDPPIVYPGNIQGRHRNEAGEKGCYHVTLSETGSNLSFIPLQAVQFNSITVDVSHCEEIHQLETIAKTKLDEQLDKEGPQLVHLTLESGNSTLSVWKSEGFLDDIVDLINETLMHQNNWIHIYRLSIKTSQTEAVFHEGDHFIGELSRHIDETSIQPFMKELYQHRQARRYLEPITKDDEQTIKLEAQELLINQLLKE